MKRTLSRLGRLRQWRVLAPAVALLVLGSVWGAVAFHPPARAADHLDPPQRTNIGASSDVASDIADIFIWNTATTVTLVLTHAGPQEPGVLPHYDQDVLYQLHLSNSGDPTVSTATIYVRYGRDASGNWGVQFTGVPGATGPISGPVQTVLTSGAVQAEAGLFADPFFFDLQGFNDTKSTGVLSIMNTRNFFAGKNDTAMIVEFPRSAIENGAHPITFWAETGRISGT